MKKESFTSSLPFRLLVALAVGIGGGLHYFAIFAYQPGGGRLKRAAAGPI